jgi:hypothetical protein
MEFDLHLLDLTFIPKVHNRVQMVLKDIDASLYFITAPRLLGVVLGKFQGPTAIIAWTLKYFYC